MSSTWPHFDSARRWRIASEIRAMLKARKRRTEEAEAVLAELERVILWRAPVPSDVGPPPRNVELPATLHLKAHALAQELFRLSPDDRELLALTFGPQQAGVAACENWVRQLQRLAGPPPAPRVRGPRRQPERDEVEDGVMAVLKRAGLTWRDGARPARVLAEVVEFAFGPGAKPIEDHAQRQMLRRAATRRVERAKAMREERTRHRKQRQASKDK